MKVTDFMIHDYVDVYYIDHPVQVVDVLSVCLYVNDTSNPVHELEYTAVHISSEILVANGFMKIVEDGVEIFLMDEKDVELTIYQEDYSWRIRICRGADRSLSIKSRYVHELQQALRVMGLYKLADNFKIELQ